MEASQIAGGWLVSKLPPCFQELYSSNQQQLTLESFEFPGISWYKFYLSFTNQNPSASYHLQDFKISLWVFSTIWVCSWSILKFIRGHYITNPNNAL